MSGWVAQFRDGPLATADENRTFAVGDPWEEIVLAPMPSEARGEHYVIVGGDDMPPIDVPWPGQLTYRLARVADPDAEEVLAVYELAAT